MAITAAKAVIERLTARAEEIPPALRAGRSTDQIMEDVVRTQGEEVDIDALYREVLDERYELICFGDMPYSPSEVLEAVDPEKFREGVQINAESEIRDCWLISLDGKCYRMEGVTDD